MSPLGNTPDQIGAGELRAIARRASRRALATSSGASATGSQGLFMSGPGARSSDDTSGTFGLGRTTNSDSRAPYESEERELVGESLVRAAAPDSELVIPPRARITPLARDLAFAKNVRFVTGRSAEPLGPASGSGFGFGFGAVRRSAVRIAIASDHGGFALKNELVPLLREMGQQPLDLGPDDGATSVDYPDFARKVALEVSEGRAQIGIIVDGAGIGSAMVANKVPGVLAANCWNEATARNAREHNHANVLTLGSGHLDLGAARAVLAAFLATPVGDGRHARRNGKTLAVESEFLRAQQLARTFDETRG